MDDALRVRPPDPPLPLVVSRAQARAAGLSDRQITRRATDGGEWRRLRRDVLLVPGGAGADRAPTADELRLIAALRSTRRDVAVGLAHAARLWGLPCPLGGWGGPTLLTTTGPHRDRGDVRVVVTPLREDEVVVLGGRLRVTSAVRTVTDCLRTMRPPDALAVADAAARTLVPGHVLVEAVDRLAGWPGVRQARRLVRLVDGRRESTFESWSALAFDTVGVEQPLWQADVRDGRGFVGRVDGWWRCGVVGEADGRSKYRLRAAELGGVSAETLAEVLDEERRREDRLWRAGLTVVRWKPSDVLSAGAAEELGRHLRARFAERNGRSFTASVLPHPFLDPGAAPPNRSGTR